MLHAMHSSIDPIIGALGYKFVKLSRFIRCCLDLRTVATPKGVVHKNNSSSLATHMTWRLVTIQAVCYINLYCQMVFIVSSKQMCNCTSVFVCITCYILISSRGVNCQNQTTEFNQLLLVLGWKNRTASNISPPRFLNATSTAIHST